MRRTYALVLAALVLAGGCGVPTMDREGSVVEEAPSSDSAVASRSGPAEALPASDTGPGWQDRKGNQALAMVHYPWARLGMQVVFRGPRTGVMAITYPMRQRIDVFVRESMPVIDVAHVVAHELGHVYDMRYNDDAIRHEWKRARGYADNPHWMVADGTSDFHLPGGDYAEVFALWCLNGEGMFKSTLAPRPNNDELADLARRFFERGAG